MKTKATGPKSTDTVAFKSEKTEGEKTYQGKVKTGVLTRLHQSHYNWGQAK